MPKLDQSELLQAAKKQMPNGSVLLIVKGVNGEIRHLGQMIQIVPDPELTIELLSQGIEKMRRSVVRTAKDKIIDMLGIWKGDK